MSTVKKLKQYIKDDRPKKLKLYVESHDIDVNDLSLGKGRTLLHYCAKYGSPDMIRCLMRLDCDPDCQDKDGNLALHLAALRALDEDPAKAQELIEGLISPLLHAYPLGQDVENKDFLTAQDLVKAVKDKVRTFSLTAEQGGRQKRQTEQEEEDMWRSRLNDEAMFEFEEQNPRHDLEEDFSQENETESYDEWSERVGRDMFQRQQKQTHQFTRDKKRRNRWGADDTAGQSSRKKSKEEEEQEKLNQAREEMKKRYKPPLEKTNNERLIEKRKRYESKFSHLLSHLSGKSLTFGCIPWPHGNVDMIAATLFCDMKDKKAPDYRKYLRIQQVRWHPDKFTQKFKDHLHPDHVEKIMNRVKAISQLLNKLSSE